jgi:4a-hydroxytetrahydrobiopterin dehydratase
MERPQKLDDAQTLARLEKLPGWTLSGGKLHRELRFSDFQEAFAFMARMALVSESLNHHPEWFNVWNRVVVDLNTHDAGGITELDFEWATRANAALPVTPKS